MAAVMQLEEFVGAVGKTASSGLAFFSVRPRLFGIAYRMLGSAAEAEDIVQDVWMRWQSTNRNAVENPSAYLIHVVFAFAT